MTKLVLHPNSSASFDCDVLGTKLPIQFSLITPTVCYIEIDDHLCPDKTLLITKGREITIKIQY